MNPQSMKPAGPKGPKKPIVAIPKTVSEASQNWALLKAEVRAIPVTQRRRNSPTKVRAKQEKEATAAVKYETSNYPMKRFGFPNYDHHGKLLSPMPQEYRRRVTWSLAIDCEMVGVGPMGEHALGRVSIVNEFGYCLLDKFVKPKVPITDYKTAFSGIRESDMVNASQFDDVVREVAALIKGHIMVGHAIHHDFKALLLNHPRKHTRDTAVFFRTVFNRTPSLKALAEKFLKIEIQSGEHSSIQDAQATMKVYLIHRKEWENKVKSQLYPPKLKNRYSVI